MISPSPRPAQNWQRIEGVDLLRGLAMFFVLMNHVNMRLLFARVPYLQGIPAQIASSLVWNGQRGVQIFFVVSGFLITSTTLRRWDALARVNVREFYRLRFARIAPLLLLLLAVLSALHLSHVGNFVVSSKTGGLGRALFAALTFHVNVLEAGRGYLPANWDILWSLSVEEMFYLFFPLACRLLGRSWLLVAVLLAFVAFGPYARAVLAQGNEVWREYSYLGSMDAIALGCLLALFLANKRLSVPALWLSCNVGTALLILTLGFSLQAARWGLGRSGLDMTVVAIGTCLIIAPAAQTNWKSPRLVSPVLALGQRSYEVYLMHMFVVFALFAWFVKAGKPMQAVPLLFLGTIVVAALLGEAAARLYSDPMNRILRQKLRNWGRTDI